MARMARRGQGSAPERLRRFVAENLEALEPDLRVLETSLRLGRSTVDVVAVDGQQTLVLVAVAEVADVTTLISALDAYISCLAFPDNVRGRYPDAGIATARPPRLVFVGTQIPPAFVELAERLSVVSPECHELAPLGEREDVAGAEPAIEDAPEPVAVALPAGFNAGPDAAAARRWEGFPRHSGNGHGANGHGANGHAANGHAAPVARAAPATPPAPKASAQRRGPEETRPVNHPALQALRFPKGEVSRQWQEFLDQLAANQ